MPRDIRSSDAERLMFGFDKPEDGSEERFHQRLDVFDQKKKPRLVHHFWWIVHNCLAHPMIGIIPIKSFFDFHDWTSRKINAE